jgi:hypothetical protein
VTRLRSLAGTGGSAFLRDVFDDVQAMWRREFEAAGAGYTPATLTIFRDEVNTGCGTETANIGPFYCPADRGVYLDTRGRCPPAGDRLARRSRIGRGAVLQAWAASRASVSHTSTGTTPPCGTTPTLRARAR